MILPWLRWSVIRMSRLDKQTITHLHTTHAVPQGYEDLYADPAGQARLPHTRQESSRAASQAIAQMSEGAMELARVVRHP